MSALDEARARRVRRVVALGARLADPADPLGAEARRDLPAATGLSPEGVELALREHLETSLSAADLASLLAATGTAPRCHVVLAANVCTAALRAVAIAAATSPRLALRPSRRDPVIAALLARVLARDDAFAEVALTTQITAAPGDELHIYGADETIAALTASADAGVIVRGHGTGLGVALVGVAADLDEAARALAADVVPFDQRGCLSPRVALVEGGPDRAFAFAAALHGALLAAGARVPRGRLEAEDRAAIAMYLASAAALGGAWEGPNHAVGVDLAPRALLLPPAARVVHVAPATALEARALLAPWERYLTAIGEAGATTSIAPAARRSLLGRMQRPPLDGPVDCRGPDLTLPVPPSPS